jgi:hypothetical protein
MVSVLLVSTWFKWSMLAQCRTVKEEGYACELYWNISMRRWVFGIFLIAFWSLVLKLQWKVNARVWCLFVSSWGCDANKRIWIKGLRRTFSSSNLFLFKEDLFAYLEDAIIWSNPHSSYSKLIYVWLVQNFLGQAVLNRVGYSPEISHGMSVEMAEHRKDLEKKTKPILDTLRSYQDLPPVSLLFSNKEP